MIDLSDLPNLDPEVDDRAKSFALLMVDKMRERMPTSTPEDIFTASAESLRLGWVMGYRTAKMDGLSDQHGRN